VVYFSNFSDQRLYRLAGDGAPSPITPVAEPGGSSFRYADGVIDAARQRWIGVREEHRGDGQVDNTLVAIDPNEGGPGQNLAQGSDFYASPRLSPDGRKLAWICWSHPNMPWVGTELWVADIAGDGMLGDPKRVAGGTTESIFQPEWSPDGALFFVSDRTGWWNLYRVDPGGGSTSPICPRPVEFGRAQWQFGQSTYAFLSADRVACTYIENGRSCLALLTVASGSPTEIALPYTDF